MKIYVAQRKVKERITGKKRVGSGLRAVLAVMVLLTSLSFFNKAGVTAFARDSLKTASYCSFVIPPEFVPDKENGLFINKNHPMESSSIKYDFYDNGLDVLMTNREKAALKEAGEMSVITDESVSLTREIYQTMQATYNNKYGQNVGFAVSSFDRITVDGYPGYKIVASYQASGEEKVHQTVYMLLSRYRTFTISMQRAEDDDCEAFFDECAASIHVH